MPSRRASGDGSRGKRGRFLPCSVKDGRGKNRREQYEDAKKYLIASGWKDKQ